MSQRKLTKFTPEQVEKFHKDGFIIVRADEIWTPEEVKALSSWTDEIVSWPEVPGKYMSYFSKSVKDGSRIFHRVENFFPYHDGYDSTFNNEWFLSLVGQLFGEPAVLYKEKINFKYPGGEEFKPHQDHAAGWWQYGHTLHISALVSIDDATKNNGCLEIVAGKHKEGLFGEKYKEIPDDVVKSMDWIVAETRPGDIVFFDSYVPHKSEANLSETPRRVLYATYNRKSEGDYRQKYYDDKRKSYPPDIERETGKDYTYKI